MVSSALTILLTSSDLLNQNQPELGLLAVIGQHLKLVPFFTPVILFKISTLAILFAALGWFGFIYFVLWILAHIALWKLLFGQKGPSSALIGPFNAFTLVPNGERARVQMRFISWLGLAFNTAAVALVVFVPDRSGFFEQSKHIFKQPVIQNMHTARTVLLKSKIWALYQTWKMMKKVSVFHHSTQKIGKNCTKKSGHRYLKTDLDDIKLWGRGHDHLVFIGLVALGVVSYIIVELYMAFAPGLLGLEHMVQVETVVTKVEPKKTESRTWTPEKAAANKIDAVIEHHNATFVEA